MSTPLAKSQDLNPLDRQLEAQVNLLDDHPIQTTSAAAEKNLSFLLDAAIYHPLGQIDVPPPFRRPFLPPPSHGTTVAQSLNQLDGLLARCDFLGAAHYAAMCLTCGLVQPIDHVTIFRLLAVRYSCLELLGQILLAAQESKALEDLTSEFYYEVSKSSADQNESSTSHKPVPKHIMPFSLRVQALRLQSIGFSDPRRGITALYDLGLEMREHITSPHSSGTEIDEYRTYLESISIHVVNSLIELGDIDCAQRTLAQCQPRSEKARKQWSGRMILLLIKLGRLSQAADLAKEPLLSESERLILQSIIMLADDKLDEAAEIISKHSDDDELSALAKSNLAVTYLYLGRIQEASTLLEELVTAGYSFQSLTVNLATIYDLSSDQSKGLKQDLVNRLGNSQKRTKAFTNADFKL